MNPREKLLAIIVGSLAGVAILALGIRVVIVQPLKAADKKILGVRQKIAKVQEERRAYFAAEDKVKAYARKAFSDSGDEASALVSNSYHWWRAVLPPDKLLHAFVGKEKGVLGLGANEGVGHRKGHSGVRYSDAAKQEKS